MPVYKSIVAFMALAYLLAATGGAAGLVACIGADGHVAIEYATGGGCTSFVCEKTERPSAGAAIRPAVPPSSHCGSCVDIPFGAGEATKQPVLHRMSPSANLHLVPDGQWDVARSRTTHAAGFLLGL
jgi:hypothetical protein